MKKLILMFILSVSHLFCSPFVEDNTSLEVNTFKEEEQDKTIDLESVQKVMSDNLKHKNTYRNIKYEYSRTYTIRTRKGMESYIILDNDPIAHMGGGNKEAFSIKKINNKKYNLNNTLVIDPNYIGIDSNITVWGESGRVYSFYIYSTDYNSHEEPHMITFISNTREKIGKLRIENLEKKEFENIKKDGIEKIENKEINVMIIGENIERLSIKLDEIERKYEQEGEEKLKALEIFNDDKWTYFKYDADNAKSKFPVIYEVIDGYDSPVNTKIVGDYIIAESVHESYTLRLGDKHVCVRKIKDD